MARNIDKSVFMKATSDKPLTSEGVDGQVEEITKQEMAKVISVPLATCRADGKSENGRV